MKERWTSSLGWTTKFCAANAWRTLPLYDFDDLFQEAFLIFEKCDSKYKDVNPRHFQSLFMSSFRNHVHDLASKRKLVVSGVDCETLASKPIDPLFEARLDASPEVRALLESSSGRLRKPRRKRGGLKESASEFLERVTDKAFPGRKIINAVTSFFEDSAVVPSA